MGRRFCVNCGAEESADRPIIDGLCIHCYTSLKPILIIPNSIDIHTCSYCGALRIGGKWYYPATGSEARELVEKYIASHVKPAEDVKIDSLVIHIDSDSHRNAKVYSDVVVKGRYRYRYEAVVNISWSKKLCPTCFARRGGGFEAVVQLRFVNQDVSAKKFVDDIRRMFHDYVVEVEEKSNGYNIKIASTSIARKIAEIAKKRWSNVRVKESYGDVKRSRDGARHARLYISLRILNLKRGDYIVLNGKAYSVEDIDEKHVVLVDSDGNRATIDVKRLVSEYEKSKT